MTIDSHECMSHQNYHTHLYSLLNKMKMGI